MLDVAEAAGKATNYNINGVIPNVTG